MVSNPRKRQGPTPLPVEAPIWAIWCRGLRQFCLTQGITEEDFNTTFMEFALLALFTCSLASVIATVFRGTY
ncbi:MAG: hypothetical protein VYE46_07265 [Cyanobacteriota bacterium]|nr:hypothetical protein [Cyanobacteriota bacterium]